MTLTNEIARRAAEAGDNILTASELHGSYAHLLYAEQLGLIRPKQKGLVGAVKRFCRRVYRKVVRPKVKPRGRPAHVFITQRSYLKL